MRITMWRVDGGYMVRTRSDIPAVFIGWETTANPKGAVLRFLDQNWLYCQP